MGEKTEKIRKEKNAQKAQRAQRALKAFEAKKILLQKKKVGWSFSKTYKKEKREKCELGADWLKLKKSQYQHNCWKRQVQDMASADVIMKIKKVQNKEIKKSHIQIPIKAQSFTEMKKWVLLNTNKRKYEIIKKKYNFIRNYLVAERNGAKMGRKNPAKLTYNRISNMSATVRDRIRVKSGKRFRKNHPRKNEIYRRNSFGDLENRHMSLPGREKSGSVKMKMKFKRP